MLHYKFALRLLFYYVDETAITIIWVTVKRQSFWDNQTQKRKNSSGGLNQNLASLTIRQKFIFSETE